MKPRTKQHYRVLELSKSLPYMKSELKSWAFENIILHIGYRTKTKTSCLSCGHSWKGHDTAKKENCPACQRKLILQTTRRKKCDQLIYFALLDVVEEFQVNRYFQMRTYHKAGEQPRIFFQEIVQQFMLPDGKHEVIARNVGYYFSYTDNFHGDMSIKDRSYIYNKYNIYPKKIYPKWKCLPIYKRNGFTGNIGQSTPFDLFHYVMNDNMAETLLKAKQFALLEDRFRGKYRIGKYWNSIKICLRNNYLIKDSTTWLDYLDLLDYFRKDLLNAKYVCPESLSREHNRLVGKRRIIQNREDAERRRYEREQNELRKARQEDNKVNPASADQLEYIEQKSQYFGLEFTQGDLTIKVLESVQEYWLESEALKHCVYTNEYFKKKDTLCFSAQINGVRIETIEVDLNNFRILQSRGLHNVTTEHNERIIKLMKKGLKEIRKRSKSHTMVAA